VELEKGEAMVWFCRQSEKPIRVRTVLEKRKDAGTCGVMRKEKCHRSRVSISAGRSRNSICGHQNLNTFLELAEGVDDETWMFHLKARELLAVVSRHHQR